MIESAAAKPLFPPAYSLIPGAPSLKPHHVAQFRQKSIDFTWVLVANHADHSGRALAPNSDGCVVCEIRGVMCGVEFRPCTIIPCQLLWNRNNDFANVLAGFHVAMRVGDVLQVKGSINYRDKFSADRTPSRMKSLALLGARRNLA